MRGRNYAIVGISQHCRVGRQHTRNGCAEACDARTVRVSLCLGQGHPEANGIGSMIVNV